MYFPFTLAHRPGSAASGATFGTGQDMLQTTTPAPIETDEPWSRKLTLLGASALTVMSGATIAPSLPAIAEHFAGVANVDLLTRLVLTVPALFMAVGAPLAGQIVDRYGRKPLLIASAIVYVLAGTSGAMLDSLYGILIGRALLGIAVAGVMTAATTLMGDYFTGAARARFMGLQAAFMAFGGVVFLSTGGLLADLSWRAPFLVYLAAAGLIPFMAATLYEPDRRTAAMVPGGTLAAADLAPWRLIWLIYAVAGLTFLTFYLLPVQLPFYLREMGVEAPSLAGLAIASGALVAAFVSLAYGRLRARFSHRAIIALGFGFMAAGYALVAHADDYPTILAAMMLNGLGMGSAMPNLSVWLMARAPARLRGRAVGGLSASIFLGQFLSPLAVQPIADPYGLAAAFAAAAGALAVFAIAFATHARLYPRAGAQ